MQPQLTDDLLNVITSLHERLALVEKNLTNDAIPIGATIEWNALPTLLPFNYLPADGRAIDRIAYAALFTLIGTTHGVGDGSSTFNIPDRTCQIYMDASSTRSGCLLLDGASYLRTTYPDLFTALGGTGSPWGLADGTHFNVPDMRGRAAIGSGTGAGLTARALGTQNIGEENHLLSGSESGVAGHTHIYTFPDVIAVQLGATNLNAGNPTTQNTGSGTSANAASSHNTMQPSGVYNFFISTTNSTVIKVL